MFFSVVAAVLEEEHEMPFSSALPALWLSGGGVSLWSGKGSREPIAPTLSALDQTLGRLTLLYEDIFVLNTDLTI